MPRFTNPPSRREFFAAVWDAARAIPPGRVITYGRLAQLAGPPGGMDRRAFDAFAARWAAGAMAHCPDDVPWWRVVNAQGRISPREGAARQRQRLEAEGVTFDARGRLDLAARSWPDARDEDD